MLLLWHKWWRLRLCDTFGIGVGIAYLSRMIEQVYAMQCMQSIMFGFLENSRVFIFCMFLAIMVACIPTH